MIRRYFRFIGVVNVIRSIGFEDSRDIRFGFVGFLFYGAGTVVWLAFVVLGGRAVESGLYVVF